MITPVELKKYIYRSLHIENNCYRAALQKATKTASARVRTCVFSGLKG